MASDLVTVAGFDKEEMFWLIEFASRGVLSLVYMDDGV